MILIGTMNITRTVGTGDFHCPTCGAVREYKLKSRRPFLTLYLIPTIPIGGPEQFLLCLGCRSHWDPAIVRTGGHGPSEAGELQFGEEALRAALLVAQASELSEEQIEVLIRISSRLLPEPVSREDLGWLASSARQNGIRAADYVRSVSPGWSSEQRQFALQAMFVAATSAPQVESAQFQLLASLRDIMDLSDQEYEAAIEAAIQWDVETAAD